MVVTSKEGPWFPSQLLLVGRLYSTQSKIGCGNMETSTVTVLEA